MPLTTAPMPIDITMPRLSDTMEQGTIIKWNVKEGDKVSAGDAIADIETDKATMEMQVYDDGRIERIVVGEGNTVEVGTVIAVMAPKGEVGAGVVSGAATPRRAAAKRTSAPGAAVIAAPPAREVAEEDDERVPDGRVKSSPLARRMADELGVDVGTIHGSGPGGRVVKQDVLRAVETRHETEAAVPPAARKPLPTVVPEARAQPAATPLAIAAPVETGPLLKPGRIPLSNIRQTIARRLIEAKTTIPHYQVTVAFDMEAILSLRGTLNEQLAGQGIKLSVNDFLVRGCALAIHQHPEFNASWGGDHLEVHEDVNIGIAIALPPERGGGLVVGTIRNADRKSLRAISQESKYLSDKARSRGLSLEEMADTTFTISNLGMFGVDNFTAIINPPNSAILAVGAALQKPVVRNGQLTVGHEMSATLSLDHRIIDGASAARYLQSLRQLIEQPATLLV
jgi:pyruvate dehydrogenase E2 component (dihydrolipoamide acetyltransferase)